MLHLVLKPPQDLAHAGGDHPCFCVKNQHQLEHGLKKNPYTRGVAPSLLWILVSLFHTAHSLSRFLNTAVQPLSDAEITCPNYLKEVTIFRGHTYALKALDVTALSYSASRCRLFRSASFLHCAVRQCILFRARYGTIMSHRGNRGWGGFPSSSITMVSQTCRCHKCTHMAVRISAWPLHPLTEQVLGPAFSGNIVLNVLGSSPLLPFNSLSFCPSPPLYMTCWFWRCIASDPLSRSFLHFGHWTRSCCLSW